MHCANEKFVEHNVKKHPIRSYFIWKYWLKEKSHLWIDRIFRLRRARGGEYNLTLSGIPEIISFNCSLISFT